MSKQALPVIAAFYYSRSPKRDMLLSPFSFLTRPKVDRLFTIYDCISRFQYRRDLKPNKEDLFHHAVWVKSQPPSHACILLIHRPSTVHIKEL